MNNGYLPPDNEIFRADLYIAAMGRSGSTALANMLTTPPKRWVLTEPWFINGAMSKTIRGRWSEFGWADNDKDWWLPAAQRTNEHFAQRYSDFLVPHLAKLDAWGVKEVRGDFHAPTIATIRPVKIIVLVRDIRDVIRSLLEKQIRQGSEATHGRPWIEQYISTASVSLVTIASANADNVKVVKFEEIMNNPAAERNLAEWLNWPLDGDPSAGLIEHGRGYEIKRRTEGEPRVLPVDAATVIEEIAAVHSAAAYQRHFGYR